MPGSDTSPPGAGTSLALRPASLFRTPLVRNRLEPFQRLAIALILPGALFLLWSVAVARGWMAPQILPSPALVAATFRDLVLRGELSDSLLISLHRIALGFAIGASTGLIIGFLLGISQKFEDYVGPTVSLLAQIPALGWVPIFILIFGLDEMLKYLIIAKASFIAVVLATAAGVRATPRRYIEVAGVLRLPWRVRLLRLWLPAAVPIAFSGLRLGLSHAWIALITVEILAATEGIGYTMVWGRTLFQLDVVIVGMIVIGVIGLALDTGLSAAERRLDAWRPPHG